jgi:hypothetical protein
LAPLSSARRMALSDTLWQTQTIMVTPLRIITLPVRPEPGVAKLLNLNENDSRLDYWRINGRVQVLFSGGTAKRSGATRS